MLKFILLRKRITQFKISLQKLLSIEENIFECFCTALCIRYKFLYMSHIMLKKYLGKSLKLLKSHFRELLYVVGHVSSSLHSPVYDFIHMLKTSRSIIVNAVKLQNQLEVKSN